VPIIDADVIAHALVQPGKPALQHIIAHFGREITHRDGTLNRAKLRDLVFTDAAQRQVLETILHPLIRQHIQQQVQTLNTTAYCLLSIPLLIEKQQRDLVHRVLVVDCPEALQRSRLAVRNGFSAAEIERVLAAQIDRQQRLASADEVLDNTQSLDQLPQKVAQLHQYYLNLVKTHLPNAARS
jgi:dephospho-CoA kinase